MYFFFDDSGVLHKNEPSGFFVYAGYVFTSKEELEKAKREYIHANKILKKALNRKDELKAATLNRSNRRSLFNALKKYMSVSVIIDISRVYDYILNDKKSVCRYKDYILKRCIKDKLKRLIAERIIDENEDITLKIYIDEQLTATNGYYDLRDSISEELKHGIANFDYGITHAPLFNGDVAVEIIYCDSERNYLIQASDILANRIWTSYRLKNKDLRNIKNHSTLTFP